MPYSPTASLPLSLSNGMKVRLGGWRRLQPGNRANDQWRAGYRPEGCQLNWRGQVEANSYPMLGCGRRDQREMKISSTHVRRSRW